MNRQEILIKIVIIVILFVFLAYKNISYSQEARTFRPIATPKRAKKGMKPVLQSIPVSGAKINTFVKDMFNSWKRGSDFGKYLSDDFYNKDTLVDAMNYKIPVDAKIRVLSTRNVRILQQYTKPLPNGHIEVTSTASVTVNTQIEFNDVTRGLRKLDGENDYILEIVAELVPVK